MPELKNWYEKNNDAWLKQVSINPFDLGYLDVTVSPKIREIVAFPDSALREISQPHAVNELLNEELRRNKSTYGGIGLSAIQLGVPWRVFIAQDRIFVNPIIVDKSDETISISEGCLSVRGQDTKVTRPKTIVLIYEDEITGETKEEEFDGVLARVIQHEMDHLDGKLIIDHSSE